MIEKLIQFTAKKDDVHITASFQDTNATRQMNTYLELLEELKKEINEFLDESEGKDEDSA